MPISFTLLVQMYHTQGLIALGKLKDPAGESFSVKVDQAELLLDIMKLLKEKTNGNLSEDELNFIDESIANLEMNLSEIKKDKT